MSDETSDRSPPRGGATIDLQTAARLAKCTPRWIQKLVAQGFIPRPERGQYTIAGVVHGRIDSLLEEQKNATKTAAASRLHDARAEEVQLRNIERRKLHIKAAQEEVVRIIDEFAGPLKADAMVVPARVTNDLRLRREIEDQLEMAFGAASKRAFAAADLIRPQDVRLGKAKPAPKRRRASTKESRT